MKSELKIRSIIILSLMVLSISFVYAEILISDVGVEYESEILNKFNEDNQIELKLVIELRDESNISLVGTKEEEVELLKQKLEWYKSKIDEVLLNYSNNSNFVVLDKTSRGFVVMVNKQCFELFVNNTKILKIRLDKPVYPTEKDYTATYDLELVEKFNESNMVKVMVELKDESGIIVNIVNGTKEEKREQLRQIDEWFQPRIDEVLSDYSNDSNIKVSSRMLRGFVVNVNERGFWRLVNDTRIVKISPSRIGYIAEEDEEDFINTSKFIENESSEKIFEETIKYKQEIDFVYLKILITFIILLTLVVMWFIYYKK